MKSDGHLGRNFLRGTEGDAINVILAAAGRNLRLLRAWIAWLFGVPAQPAATCPSGRRGPLAVSMNVGPLVLPNSGPSAAADRSPGCAQPVRATRFRSSGGAARLGA